MSCVVGIEGSDGVWMGGDSAAVDDVHLTRQEAPKVFRVGEYLLGFVDSFRMGQLLRYRLKVPRQRCEDDLEHLATVFVDAVRSTFEENGYSPKAEDGTEAGGQFLIGYRRRLYYMDSDFHVGRSRSGFEAIGSGSAYAMGSLASTFTAPEGRIRLALSVAAVYCTTVAAPFTIETL